jgi:hypothetical protein
MFKLLEDIGPATFLGVKAEGLKAATAEMAEKATANFIF